MPQVLVTLQFGIVQDWHCSPYLPQDVLKSLNSAFSLSGLDCWNSLLVAESGNLLRN